MSAVFCKPPGRYWTGSAKSPCSQNIYILMYSFQYQLRPSSVVIAWLDQRLGSANPAVKIFSPRRSSLTRATTSQAPGPIGAPFPGREERPERSDPAPPLDLLAGQEIAPDDVEARERHLHRRRVGRATRSRHSRIATRRSATGPCKSRPNGRTPAIDRRARSRRG